MEPATAETKGGHGGARPGAGRKRTRDQDGAFDAYSEARKANGTGRPVAPRYGPGGEVSPNFPASCPHGKPLSPHAETTGSKYYAPTSKCKRCRVDLLRIWAAR